MKEIDWSYRLYLDRKLYLACIQLQADKKLSKSKAGLLALTEGLHSLGYLEDGDYELYRRKYSISLNDSARQVSLDQILAREEKTHNKNRQMNRHFGEVLAQWSALKPSAKQYHIKEAEKHVNLKNAKLILDLANPQNLELNQR